MENQEHTPEKDQIEENQPNQDQMTSRSDDAGYTPQEDQFADGKGTQLNEQIAPDRGDIEDELSEDTEGLLQDQQFEDEQLDEDLEDFKSQE